MHSAFLSFSLWLVSCCLVVLCCVSVHLSLPPPHPPHPTGPIAAVSSSQSKVIIPGNARKLHTNLVSWNVNGLNNPVKTKRVLDHLQHMETGIAFLQETHLRTLDHFRIRKGWVGQMFHSNFHSKSRGTAILIHKDVPFSVSSSISDPNGRYVMVSGTLYNTALAHWLTCMVLTGMMSISLITSLVLYQI